MAFKFYYFGYGSNMLTKRLHIQNPTAVRLGPGKLTDYRLDFYTMAHRWQGSPATIVPTKGDCVWGAIWEIDQCNMKDLDNQEGVHNHVYTPITVPVFSVTLNSMVDCRAYLLCQQPDSDLKSLPIDNIPINRQPSLSYLKTLVKGAIETGVPEEYIKWLKQIKHNSNKVQKF